MSRRPLTYAQPPLVLEADRVMDPQGCVRLDDLPDPQPRNPRRLRGATPLVERMWRIALRDVERNIVEAPFGRYLGAGPKFGDKIFIRDISFAGILGLNKVFPELMIETLHTVVQRRLEVGWRVPRYAVTEGMDLPCEPEDVSGNAFAETYKIGNYPQGGTDDVAWLWCAGDLLSRADDMDQWAWMYETGQRCFDTFYDRFFAPSDGLFRGQASFNDVHYEHGPSICYPQDWTISACIRIKATSTNGLYARGMDVMAAAAGRLGRRKEAQAWRRRADALRQAMTANLRFDNGAFTYFKHEDGRLEPRREALGAALAVLSGAVKGEQAVRALAGYPVTDLGVPVMFPFLCPDRYQASFGFLDTFFLMAWEQATGTSWALQNLAMLARACRDEEGFHELIELKLGRIEGSPSQLWTAGAFLGTCLRAGGELREPSQP